MFLPICPKCDIQLNSTSMGKCNYLKCYSCNGEFISLLSLNKKTSNKVILELWEKSKASPLNNDVKCPTCIQGMNTLTYPEEKNNLQIELDVCRPCKSIWLDYNEKELLEETSKTPPLSKVAEVSKKSTSHYKRVSAPGGIKTLITLIGFPMEVNEDIHKNPPIVTWLLITASIILSILAFTDISLFKFLQFSTNKSFLSQLANSLSVFFVHGGWFHLIGNMYFLYVFGDNVEADIGKFKYICLIMLATLISTFAFTLTDQSGIPLVGASGGISGLMSYYLLRFPKRKFVVSYFFNWFYISSVVFGALYLLKDLFGLVFSQSSGIAHISHLSGMFVGALFYFILNKRSGLSK